MTIGVQLSLVPELPDRLCRCYFGTEGRLVKIGSSINVKRRGGQLGITILFSLTGDHTTEQRYQDMWAKHRVHGAREWYWPDTELIEWLITRTDPTNAKAVAAIQRLIRNKHRREAA
jgi:hypothetical protein